MKNKQRQQDNSSSVLNEDEQKRYLLEGKIMQQISKANVLAMKIIPLPTLYSPIQIFNQNGELKQPQFRPQNNYHDEFWKLYLKNQQVFKFIRNMSDKTQELKQSIMKIQKMQSEYKKLLSLVNLQREKKKNRRFSNQIQKKFQCPYLKCYKQYGSDVSMNLHIKIKHNGGNKTDRQKLAQSICIAEMENKQPPVIDLNLPPNYLQEYKEKFYRRKDIIREKKLARHQIID